MNNLFESDAAGLNMHHAGKAVSFSLEVATPADLIIIKHNNANGSEISIKIEGDTIESVAPSIEGSVLWVRTMAGHEAFYDTLTGTTLSVADLTKMNQHFWGD